MSRSLLSTILLMNLAGWGFTFTIDKVDFELMDESFRLSLNNDPDIKWVAFHVNINKQFRSFETGQMLGHVSMPINRKWSYTFDKALKDTDIIYVWLAVQHNRLIFRDKQEPISVEAFKSGNPNYRISTTTEPNVEQPVTQKGSTSSLGTDKKNICRPTVTVVPKTFGGPYCRDDLVFSDDFNTLNTQYWTNEIRLPPTHDDAEYVLYNGTAGVEEGILKIEASLSQYNVKKDTIDLGARCTIPNVNNQCSLEPKGVLILPPVTTGRLSTENHFSFKYGRIEVRAKLPIGDWLFPLISLKPTKLNYGDHYKSGEMRVAFAHGNRKLMWQNQNINGARLYGGVILKPEAEARHQFMKDTIPPNVEHLGNDFHLYSMKWTPDELVMSVDGNEYGRINSNFKETINEHEWEKGAHNAPLDQMFYITLGLSAGGNGDFPNVDGKPWTNTDPRGSINFHRNRNEWHGSWNQPTLEVDYVRVYAV